MLELVEAAPQLAGPGLTGTIPNGRGGVQRLLSAEEAALVQRFDPSGELDTIGFFIAKIKKTGSTEKEKGGDEVAEAAAPPSPHPGDEAAAPEDPPSSGSGDKGGSSRGCAIS